MKAPLKPACETCAFREGCVTSREPYNVLRAEVCVLAGLPFFCHHVTDLHKKKRRQNFSSIAEAIAEARAFKHELRQNGVCRGWQARIRELAEHGWFKKNRLFRRAIGGHALEFIDEWVSMRDGKKRRAVHTKIMDALCILADRQLAPKTVQLTHKIRRKSR